MIFGISAFFDLPVLSTFPQSPLFGFGGSCLAAKEMLARELLAAYPSVVSVSTNLDFIEGSSWKDNS